MAEKIIKTGNSAAVTLPARFVKDLNLRIGDPVEVEMDYTSGEITFRFPGARQLRLASSQSRGKNKT
ncbi:AbrB/MazE/SpoVT family DNA-binding domain-containing protein [Candidatus Saccharibacteria bacterium]|nr:AbrB/MazE/SpoVT family DNA-binding domain-containing protein [Candidatus Saccharibacteria bacterium]